MSELAQLNAKVDMLQSTLSRVLEAVRANEKPMTRIAFARRVGLSRNTITARINRREIVTKNDRIPPSELRKFGL